MRNSKKFHVQETATGYQVIENGVAVPAKGTLSKSGSTTWLSFRHEGLSYYGRLAWGTMTVRAVGVR